MKLIITSSNQKPRELQLASSASIGRSADNTIHVDDPGVARNHAMIEKRPHGFWLSDLGSANGTLVNGAQITAEYQLKKGDTISLGHGTAIRVAALDGQAAANPAGQQQAASSTTAGAPPSTPAESGVPMAHAR